jgi:hypothetical protein
MIGKSGQSKRIVPQPETLASTQKYASPPQKPSDTLPDPDESE